jgi:glutamate--cysteine ligase
MGNESFPAVPHLTTALTGPLQEIEIRLLQNQAKIEQWFRTQFRATPAPFYCSVDLRNSGFKLAPVDTNLFPAGFNNLNPAFRPLCVQAVQTAVERICPEARGVLVVPENHTRNVYYFEHLATLIEILRLSGLNVRIGSLRADVREPWTVPVSGGRRLVIEPLERSGDKVRVGDFEPCFILLNNDLSGGRPAILEGLAQPVIPPLALGWRQRRKSHHFAHYRRLAEAFAALLGIDPWLITPYSCRCEQVDFLKRTGEDCLVAGVEAVLEQVRAKYREYGIAFEPFVMIKADAGTYGMAVMTVKNAEQVRELNRKQRTRMAHAKEGSPVSDVLVQEGIYTFETWGEANAVAEPVVYMIDHYVVGGFYRVHRGRGPDENLNAPGMHFEPLAFAGCGAYPERYGQLHSEANRFYAYGVIARLALLAAAHELREVEEASGKSPKTAPGPSS